MHVYDIKKEKNYALLAGMAQFVGCHLAHREVTSLLPGQDT